MIKPLDWYVLLTSPLAEKAVANRLKRRHGAVWLEEEEVWICESVATYVPVLRKKVRHKGDHRWIERVLMPRYLFVGLAMTPAWYDILDIAGVQGVLGVDGTPQRIDAGEVGRVIWLAESGQLDPPVAPKIQRGMQVVAKSGKMRGFEGRVVTISREGERAGVMFDLFGGVVPVAIGLDDLVSVSYSSQRMTG